MLSMLLKSRLSQKFCNSYLGRRNFLLDCGSDALFAPGVYIEVHEEAKLKRHGSKIEENNPSTITL